MTISITCPTCGTMSHHPTDVAEGYCGRCNDWTTVKRQPMTSMIFKVDQEPGTDRYMIWSTVTDMPSVIGTRDDMIAWLQPPTGDSDRAQAMRVMSYIDQTGTSDRTGRGGWHDLEPIPVGDIAPDDGWYHIRRGDLPALADAIGHGDAATIHQLFVKYAD